MLCGVGEALPLLRERGVKAAVNFVNRVAWAEDVLAERGAGWRDSLLKGAMRMCKLTQGQGRRGG